MEKSGFKAQGSQLNNSFSEQEFLLGLERLRCLEDLLIMYGVMQASL